MRVGKARTRVLLRPPSSVLRKIFTLAPDAGPLCPKDSERSLVVAIHMRREFRVDMSEFVYSFARGMLNMKSHPASWKINGQ